MKKKILLTIGIILLIGLLVGSYFVFGSYSEGYRAGTVMKLSKKGVVFKTYEGQLNTGGITTGGGEGGDIASTIWEFSVSRSNDEVVSAIEKAVDNGNRVKLFYEEKFYQLDFLGDTKYFVYKVEEVGSE